MTAKLTDLNSTGIRGRFGENFLKGIEFACDEF
jgi:hypothetical protein